MNIPRRMFAVVGVALLVAACGSTSPSQAGTGASPGTDPAPSVVAAAAASTPAVGAVCDKAARAFDPTKIDLTGKWAGDDGGIYFLRQLGTIVWWNGMADRAGRPEQLGHAWNNVARGEIDGPSIDVSWADVPRGGILDGGTMKLKIEDDGTGNVRIVKVSEQTGDFGNKTWTPCKSG
jgi:hypothetical protein